MYRGIRVNVVVDNLFNYRPDHYYNSTPTTTGTTVSVVGRAPLKDPVALRLSGVTISLRNSEADYHQGRCVRRGPLSFYPSSVGTVLSNLASVAVPCGGGRDVLSSFGEYRPSAFVIRTVKQKEEL